MKISEIFEQLKKKGERIVKFTNQEYKDMIEAAWAAFEATLSTWGVTEDQINKFYRYADDSIVKIDDYVSQVILSKED